MQDAARVYAEALFEVAKEKDKLDPIGAGLGEFADALDSERDLRVFFFSPHFSSAEKVEGLGRALSGAEPELVNFLELLIEKQRMTEVFRIRREFEQLWKREQRRIDVTVTSAAELDSGGGREDRRARSNARPARRSTWSAASTARSSAASSCR